MTTNEVSENSKEYEISYLLAAPEQEAILKATLSTVGAVEIGGQPLRTISLAYPINKHASAELGVKIFKSDNQNVVSELNSALKLKSEILRFLIVSVQKKPIVSKTPETVEVKSEKPKSPIAPPVSDAITNEALEQKLEEILRD